ncbi:MAG: hypothetical protein E7267_07580 [Lachnospiraceae bacterium]|nr:hypothetical protein [Lachnospiraceae bacterium]
MHSIDVKKIIRIAAGVFAVIIMSAAFSGYSFKIKHISELTYKFACNNSPLLYMSENLDMNEDSKGSICSYYYNLFNPYGYVISEAAEKYRNNRTGTVMSAAALTKRAELENESVTGEVEFMGAEGYLETGNSENEVKEVLALPVDETEKKLVNELKTNKDVNYLLKNFYVVDSTTSVKKNMFDVADMLARDYRIEKGNGPQILIYHTHAASEKFEGNPENMSEDGITGIGSLLAAELTNTYGYNVMHDKTQYDRAADGIDRSLAYANALPAISKILSDNPGIQVVIDLHRDGVAAGKHTAVNINGQKTAQIMFFNGTSRSSDGARKYLKNDNLTDNLAFSLQMKLKSMELYPGFARPIYLKGYRYNMHLSKRCLLIELGNQNNTYEEAKNAVKPLAHILNEVLKK